MHAVAYFDGAYGKDLARDMEEIYTSGARDVIYCVPERAARFNRQGVIENVAVIRQAGLRCFMNFWGAFGIFGGEDFSGFVAAGGVACNKNPEFRAAVADLIGLAAEAGADGIFWDEPELKCRTASGEVCCETIEFLAEVTAHARALFLLNEVCIPPIRANWQLLESVSRLLYVDIISTNAYYDIEGYKFKYELPHIHVTKWSSYISYLGKRYRKVTRMWLQGFKQVEMSGLEHMPMSQWLPITAQASRLGGIRNFALWAFKGCESMSSLRPNGDLAQCAAVWDAASAVFRSTPTD